jgi:drug/metabolite transporter (DMT)-like permease
MAPTSEPLEKVKYLKEPRAGLIGLLLLVIGLKPLSNLFLASGMRHFPEALAGDPVLYLRVVANPFVAAGIAMQILWLLMRMALLSVADLSFVLPVTAIGYVISTLLARVFLHEQVSLMRWMGTGVIFLGTALVMFTMRGDVRK